MYQLGYNLVNNKIYPRIEIYRYEQLSAVGRLGSGAYASLFFFYSAASSRAYSVIDTINGMFTELRKYHDIPQYIEAEYEDMFLLYKLNNFKKL